MAWRRQSHLDVLGGETRSAWLCGWQRSGSTWVASILASAPGTRLVYEPANVPGRLFTGEGAAAVPLPTGPGPELEAIEAALRGRARGQWVDQLSDVHVVRRRVVKDVRATGLLPLVAARHPKVPVVVLLRHPLSIARSVVGLGWVPPGSDDETEAMLDEVRRWIELHTAAFRSPAVARAHLVTYEHLVLSPDDVLPGVVSHLAAYHPTWRNLAVDRQVLTAPSATSFRRDGTRSAAEWIGTFDGLSTALVDRAASLLHDAGLGDLYGASHTPLVAPDDVRDAVGA